MSTHVIRMFKNVAAVGLGACVSVVVAGAIWIVLTGVGGVVVYAMGGSVADTDLPLAVLPLTGLAFFASVGVVLVMAFLVVSFCYGIGRRVLELILFSKKL